MKKLKVSEWLPFFLILSGVVATRIYNHLLFHTLSELFSIAIAFALFAIPWHARSLIDNNYLSFIGTAYLFVGLVDLIHTLAYKGMGVFAGYGANLLTQLWIVARYMESSSILLAFLSLRRRIVPEAIFGVLASVTALALFIVFLGVFPDCFVEGK